MSDSEELKNPLKQPMYIVWVLTFIVALSLFEIFVPIGLYCANYGVPTLHDLLTNMVAEYSDAALWKGRVWHPLIEAGALGSQGMGRLASFDPEKGDLRESSFKITVPLIGLIADGDRLWVVSSSTVTRIEGDQATEFKPSRALTRTSEPFLYKNQPALIDIGANRQPTLLVFSGDEWTDIGTIAVPFHFGTTNVNGKLTIVPATPTKNVGASLMDLKIVSQDGEFLLFISDGSTVAFKVGMELAPASALAPENGIGPVDLSNLDEWEIVCSTTTGLGRAGIGLVAKSGWKVGMVNGHPIVVTASSSNPNPFQGNTLLVYRRIGDQWKKTTELPTQTLLSLLVVSDEQKTFVSGQSYAQILRIHTVSDSDVTPNGVVIKAPVSPLQKPIERISTIGNWIYWPSLLVLGLVLSRLMATYLGNEYQFGITTVELASMTRRGIARMIDLGLIWMCNLAIVHAFGMSSQAQVDENLDKFFDLSPNGLLVRAAWLYLCMILCSLVFVFMNSLLQGFWGITLGKWICGIQTVRTTLRRCGFLRAFLRELMMTIDIVFGISFIPATLAIAFSRHHQRLGDMVADTIVIKNRKPESRV